ncbi:ATP-dependent nuclease [Undibacterium sp. Tian12W]|uniref:ATP-dependent nuclease n=1 Tax=Undibacterium sp. Tian12W TaxID=3413054 RepID=UPI003BF37701
MGAMKVSTVKIRAIRFHNFKSLKDYSVSFHSTNILVGPNNAGKSTIISALRILEVALKRAKSRNPERIHIAEGKYSYGHFISVAQLGISLENVASDYNSEDSTIEFRLSNGNKLCLFFSSDGTCILHWENDGPAVTTVARFRTEFPISIQVVPVLGQLEHNEPIVNEATVTESLNSHRASRHFRNYWHYFPEGWEEYSTLIASTWPGMVIAKPEIDYQSKKLTMFIEEDRIAREIYWAGFGFQIWCQLLTHISRASKSTLLAIDEPEIYLHPDVQRQLLIILRQLSTDVLLATHSVEIIGEADPSEILLVQKGRKAAQRLEDVSGMQLALRSIGSAQNVTLTHLARTKKIVFVEGFNDFKTLRRFAIKLGYAELSVGNDLTPFESGGFTTWEKVRSFAWGIKSTIDVSMKIFAIYDRDYFCSEQIEAMSEELKKELSDAQILSRKEMENYLLNIDVLQRVLTSQIDKKNKGKGAFDFAGKCTEQYLQEITEKEKLDIQAQYISKKLEYHNKSSKDRSTLSKEVLQEFESKWSNIRERMKIIPGKTVLRELRTQIKEDYGVNLTDVQIISEFKNEEIPFDLKNLIYRLDEFRKAS